MKLERSFQFDLMNPLRADIPEEIRAISPILYQFLLEQTRLMRELHNKAQAGDTTFPWEVLTFTSETREYTLGSLGRFNHPDYGLILARYCKFMSMNDAIYEGSPVGFTNRQTAKSWEVTNQLFASSEDLCVGLCAAYEKPKSGSFGWVIVSGVNLQTAYADAEVKDGDTLGWNASGVFGVTKYKIGRVKGNSSVFSADLGWEIPIGSLVVDALAVATKYTEPVTDSNLEDKIQELGEEITQQGNEFTDRFGILTRTVNDAGNAIERTGRIISDRILAYNPDRIRGQIQDSINLVANYANLSGVAADNATSAANTAVITLQAITSLTQSAEISKTEAGLAATAATEMRNEAGVHRNDAIGSADAAATFATQASVSATNAATSASAAATSQVNAATSASNASVSQTNAATSATTASGAAATATSQAVVASNAAITAQNGGGVKFDASSLSNFSSLTGSNVFVPLDTVYWSKQSVLNTGWLLQLDQRIAGTPNSGSWGISPNAKMKVTPARTYRVTLRIHNAVGPAMTGQQFYILFLNSSGTYIGDTGNLGPATIPIGGDQIYTWDITSANLLNPGSGYFGSGPNVASIVPFYRNQLTGANVVYIVDMSIDDITQEAALSASVTTLSTAVTNLDNQLAAASFSVTTIAGSATAALRIMSETSPGVFQSSVSLEAQEIQFYNNSLGTRVLAGRIAGGVANWTGDLNVGGKILIGSQRIPVALQPFPLSAGDGDSVSFGTDLVNVPKVLIDPTGLAALASGQQYDLRAQSLTSTGFVFYAKIITASGATTASSGAGSNVGGTPQWQVNKPTVF
jgi:hypothetical protein